MRENLLQILTPVTGDEFIRKILDGERDFSNISLQMPREVCLNELEGFDEAYGYLKKEAEKEKLRYFDRLIITNSSFRGISTSGNINLRSTLFLPYAFGKNVDFRDCSFYGGVNFYNSTLLSSDFSGSFIQFGFFRNANLGSCKFNRAYLDSSDFNDANLDSASFYKANMGLNGVSFYQSNLRLTNFVDVKNLDRCNFGKVNMDNVRVTGREKEIIDEILERNSRYQIVN